jgi:short-subunit dehydrogenase
VKLQDSRILYTGAAGGIGAETARLLASRGARLALVDRPGAPLAALAEDIASRGGRAHALDADLLDPAARSAAIARARRVLGEIDILINGAGLLSFRPFGDEDPEQWERLMRLNLLVPMALTRALLPGMIERGRGRIVNIGSTFGSIGFACFSAYSASKFGLRGFSEALRRELDGRGVGVTYVAPRAVKTAINTEAVYRMAGATGMKMDEPAWVAERVVRAIEQDRKDVYLGWPESWFVRLNALLPRLVDAGLRTKSAAMTKFATEPASP